MKVWAAQTGKRGELINLVYFGCFGSSKDLFTQMSDYLQTHYDLRHTVIITNSDGGSGYEANKFEGILGRYKSFDYCLDSYHVMKYVTGKLGFDKGFVRSGSDECEGLWLWAIDLDFWHGRICFRRWKTAWKSS